MKNQKAQDRVHLSTKQYASSKNLSARWNLYSFCSPPIDIHQKGLDALNLQGDETILDIGCGSGTILLDLYARRQHRGKLIGLDISPGIFADAQQKQKDENISSLAFIAGSADELPFDDESIDVILGFFMLYHMPDIPRTLREWHRVLRPGGKALIATSALGHMAKHRQFALRIETILGVSGPKSFSSSFQFHSGMQQAKTVFDIESDYLYEGAIVLQEPEPYIAFLTSVRDMYSPIPTHEQWSHAMAIIQEEVNQEIQRQGYYTDAVKRGYFICRQR